MTALLRLNVGPRIAVVLGVVGALAVGVLALGVVQNLTLRAQLRGVPSRIATRLDLAEWKSQTAINAARTAAVLQSDDAKLGERVAAAMKATSARISELQQHVEAAATTAEERELLARAGEARAAYTHARDDLMKLKATQPAAAAAAYEATFLPALDAYGKAVDAFVAAYARAQESAQAQAEDAAARALVTSIALGALSLLLGAWLCIVLTRSITRPLRAAADVATRVACGDLTARLAPEGRDETAQLLRAIANMNGSLARIVGEVRAGTEAIGIASREIAAGNQDLSQRTEEQASSLEETAASMEELTATVRQNADNARQASELAAGASDIAARGGHVVADVISTMEGISQASGRIADIIGVIDGIAFQTNILALNAAVEAARAGEQGRGFAVVAAEVRNLAQRSAAAAKEIKALIEDSVTKVHEGSRLVDSAGETIGEVVAAVRRVTDIMAEITAASQEQSAGIEQVSQAVTQMDQVTQQNAALVEEAAAAAESMREQARALAQAVAVFKVPGDGTRPEDPSTHEAPAPVRRVDVDTSPPAYGAASAAAPARTWPEVERRGPNRAKNVTRIAPSRSGGSAGTGNGTPASRIGSPVGGVGAGEIAATGARDAALAPDAGRDTR